MRKKNRKTSRLKTLLPRKGERKSIELWGAFALSALVVCIFIISSADRLIIRSDQYAAVIAAVLVDLANGDRTSQRLDSLTINPALVVAAQAKADDMATYSYFAHVSPQGVDPWHWFKEAGYSFNYAGENLAVDFSDSSDVNTAWMNSPTHRENILDPHFTEIGIATAQGMYQGRPTVFVVQEFGAPSSSRVIEPVRVVTTPKNPTEPALATTLAGQAATSSAVLGEATTKPSAPVQPKSTVAQTLSAQQTDVLGSNIAAAQPTKTVAAALVKNSTPDYAPWWQHIIASPREMLQYAYYIIALLVLLGLVLTTGLELRWHHRGKAAAAGFVLALICTLFIVGNSVVFPQPTLTPNASMTAAAGAGF